MLSADEVRRYREMGPERRYAIFLEMAAWAWESIDADGPEVAKRRWELIRRQHDEGAELLAGKFRGMA